MMKKFLIYLLIMGFTLYGMIMYNQPSLLIVFIFELLMLLTAVLLIAYLRFKISSAVRLPKERFRKGAPATIMIQVKNASIIPVLGLKLIVHYQYSFSEKKHKIVIPVSIDRKSEELFQCQITPEYCGCLTVTHTVLKAAAAFRIAVFPDLYPTDITYSKDKSGDDPSEIFRIREYAAGDKLQHIHWKLTARKGLTMVKEYSQPAGYNVVFLLDINKAFKTEHLWEITFAIAYGLLEADCCFYLGRADERGEGIIRGCR